MTLCPLKNPGEKGVFSTVFPGEGLEDSTLGFENWASLEQGLAPDCWI
jgi:hypothetical protein